MATIVVGLQIDETRLAASLQEVAEKLEMTSQEIILDFSSVQRLDFAALCALKELAKRANEKSVNVTLRAVDVDVYKTLKLVKLASQFSFAN